MRGPPLHRRSRHQIAYVASCRHPSMKTPISAAAIEGADGIRMNRYLFVGP